MGAGCNACALNGRSRSAKYAYPLVPSASDTLMNRRVPSRCSALFLVFVFAIVFYLSEFTKDGLLAELSHIFFERLRDGIPFRLMST